MLLYRSFAGVLGEQDNVGEGNSVANNNNKQKSVKTILCKLFWGCGCWERKLLLANTFFCCCCSVAQSCPILCNHLDHSPPGPLVLHCLHVPSLLLFFKVITALSFRSSSTHPDFLLNYWLFLQIFVHDQIFEARLSSIGAGICTPETTLTITKKVRLLLQFFSILEKWCSYIILLEIRLASILTLFHKAPKT